MRMAMREQAGCRCADGESQVVCRKQKDEEQN